MLYVIHIYLCIYREIHLYIIYINIKGYVILRDTHSFNNI